MFNPNVVTLTEDERKFTRSFRGRDPEELVESMKTKEAVERLVGLMRKVAPKVAETMIDERDVILADSIRNAPGKRIVAVVGLAHLNGIEKNYLKKV